ncbi:hypothetical protein KY332_00915 [Candidatus Woesearchaeota archaeon]|nr:hypothetical protein [Candidatus Woesearchaeota archaeon]
MKHRKNIDNIIEEFEDLPQKQGFRKGKSKQHGGKSKSRPEKVIDLSVKKLLNASEEELQRWYVHYEAGFDNSTVVDWETKNKQWDAYQRVVRQAVEYSINQPFIFHRLSKILVERANLRYPIVEEGKKIKRYHTKWGGEEPVFEKVYKGHKKGVKELNKFIANIPSEDDVELIFNWSPGLSSWNIKKTSTKKSRQVSLKDINGKKLIDIIVRVNSPENGEYSFHVSNYGSIQAEKQTDYSEFGL